MSKKSNISFCMPSEMGVSESEGPDGAAASTAAGFHDLAPDFLRHKAHSQLPSGEVWSLGRLLLHISEAEASSERNVAPLVAAFLLAQVLPKRCPTNTGKPACFRRLIRGRRTTGCAGCRTCCCT